MARIFTRIATAAACAAVLSLAAAPVSAHGWGGPRPYRHGGVSGGDVLAGALVLGGIVAIASAANRDSASDDRDYRYDDPQPYPQRSSGWSGGGIDNAVSMCVDQVERGQDRVAAVDNAARTTDGWRISGQLTAGANFSCWIDNDGRIRDVDLGGQNYVGTSAQDAVEDAPAYDGTGPDNRPIWHGGDAGQPADPDQRADATPAGGQWDDDSYARAREQVDSARN